MFSKITPELAELEALLGSDKFANSWLHRYEVNHSLLRINWFFMRCRNQLVMLMDEISVIQTGKRGAAEACWSRLGRRSVSHPLETWKDHCGKHARNDLIGEWLCSRESARPARLTPCASESKDWMQIAATITSLELRGRAECLCSMRLLKVLGLRRRRWGGRERVMEDSLYYLEKRNWLLKIWLRRCQLIEFSSSAIIFIVIFNCQS